MWPAVSTKAGWLPGAGIYKNCWPAWAESAAPIRSLPAPQPLRSVEHAFERGTRPLRDERFVTFANTGDYDVADGEPRYPAGSYEICGCGFCARSATKSTQSKRLARSCGISAFATFRPNTTWRRITWDEARHTEIGHRTLLASGYDPFELPNRLTGSTCRGPMEPAFAMAEINLFGEVGVLKTIGGLIDVAAERHDELLVHAADYIRSDERTHVRKGRHIIRVMTDLGAGARTAYPRAVHANAWSAWESSNSIWTFSRSRAKTSSTWSASERPGASSRGAMPNVASYFRSINVTG